MENKFWDQKIKIKGESFSVKSLIFTLPNRFEYKIFLTQQNRNTPDVFFKFIFNIESVTKIKTKILIKGKANGLDLQVMHSVKLYKLFSSLKSVNLCGKIENDCCFFPDILKNISREDELCSVYNEFTQSVKQKLKDSLPQIPISLREILSNLHFPKNLEDVKYALYQLFKIELFIFRQIAEKLKKPRNPYLISKIPSPFKLTEDQEITWKNILIDCQKDHNFIRVIHGEVGSGKTLIAYLSSMLVVKNKKKVAIMAPTGILANQIYDFFIKNNPENIPICLITSDSIKKDKKTQWDEYEIFIGTQALLYKKYVENLGLLIIDEQHKFGVNQRNNLLKDNNADLLMLTATPIPRTFQMMMKGYIGFSVLKSSANNAIRNTVIVSNTKIDQVIAKLLEIAQKNKVIWVCKTIEIGSERFSMFQKEITNTYFINGTMKDKNEILKNFDEQENGILVSTTVIEVGIDIDVNFIFIEDADMFGFAQLHQFRGRVGRRGKSGHCILIGKNLSKLKQIKISSDGFAITELDSKVRGSGIIHGTQQSGFNAFRFAKTLTDFKITSLNSNEIDISDYLIDPKIDFLVDFWYEDLDLFQNN